MPAGRVKGNSGWAEEIKGLNYEQARGKNMEFKYVRVSGRRLRTIC